MALQATSNDIASKVEEAERTEQEIDDAREQYRPVAIRASLLFFCIADLAGVDPMYQYSLSWFVALFLRTVQATPEVFACSMDPYYGAYNCLSQLDQSFHGCGTCAAVQATWIACRIRPYVCVFCLYGIACYKEGLLGPNRSWATAADYHCRGKVFMLV